MNMLRAPEGGRNWESQGADPYLTSQSVILQVRGIQGQGVMACGKHWIGNEQEVFRQSSSSNIDDRTLHEFYMPPFQAAIDEGVGSFMASYNFLENVQACESAKYNIAILKGEMGFKGLIVTGKVLF